jgi:glutathione S-transferase
MVALIDDQSTGDDDGNPPVFAPPALRVRGEGKNGKDLLIYQTPSILYYLGDKLDLGGDHSAEKVWVLSHALTALDFTNETHDTHHPIAVSEHYEDQQDQAMLKAKKFREQRVPKFFSFFERVLRGNMELGHGKHLVGGKLSYADTTLWQVLDGLHFAFPTEIDARKTDYPTLFETFYPTLQEHDGVKEYLVSNRRKPYSEGLFRHYPELDRGYNFRV